MLVADASDADRDYESALAMFEKALSAAVEQGRPQPVRIAIYEGA